jgi:hypothetical protein
MDQMPEQKFELHMYTIKVTEQYTLLGFNFIILPLLHYILSTYLVTE